MRAAAVVEMLVPRNLVERQAFRSTLEYVRTAIERCRSSCPRERRDQEVDGRCTSLEVAPSLRLVAQLQIYAYLPSFRSGRLSVAAYSAGR
jgi:hypothetical protein